MKDYIKKIGIILLGIAFVFAGCASNVEGEQKIIIGSKDFTENLIVSEIYALALEDAGFKVERKQNIAGSLIHEAIINDEIDLYPEYTGTGLISILKKDLITDSQKVYDTVKQEYNEQYQISWLDYASANNSAGIVIKTSIANEYDIKTISDLQKHAKEIRFASQGEFDQRSDGLPLLEEIYGKMEWKSSKVYDNSLKYEVLKNDEADAAPAYTTDAPLVDTEMFTVLEDDKKVWPPYNLAPIIRNDVLEKNSDIELILNKISKRIDNKTIIELNAKVDIDKEDFEIVAKDFFESIK